jgi:hypothetical protein
MTLFLEQFCFDVLSIRRSLVMKKIISAGTTLALLMAAGSAFADNSLNTGTMGLNVSVSGGQMISGKDFIAKDTAVLAGFGFTNTSGTGGGTAIGLMGGIRKYMKTEDFAPFVGGRLSYTTNGRTTATSDFVIGVEAGAEYFLAKHFSIEGSVGFGIDMNSAPTFAAPTTTTSTTILSTGTAGLSANFYF